MERDALLGLDYAKDVGVDVAYDARRVLHRQLIERLCLEVDPADPVAAVGDDLEPPDFGRLIRRPRFWRKMTNSPPSSRVGYAEIDEQRLDLLLVGPV